MRAALLSSNPGDFEVVNDLTVSGPLPGEVMVRVHHSGICHSDLTVVEMGHWHPIVLGHEAAGEIVDVGADVADLAVGDRVVIAPLAPCGDCPACQRTLGTECLEALDFMRHLRPDGTSPFHRNGEPVFRGLGVGGFSELTVVSANAVARVPDNMPLSLACLLGCAVQTGVGAVLNTAKVEPGSTVLVMGGGGVGQAVVQGARIAGASRIVLSDPLASRREQALLLGATDVVDPNTEPLLDVVAEFTNGRGVDYAFEAAGRASLVEDGINASGVGGTTVMVGAPPLDESVTINAAVLFMTLQKRLVGSVLGHSWPKRDIPRLAEFWQDGILNLEGMVSRQIDLTDITTGFDLLRSGQGIRTVVDVAGPA